MSKLLSIQGIGPQEVELLDAAGWGDVRSLATADPGKLAGELSKANSMLRIVSKLPDQATVEAWIQDAKDLHNGVPVRRTASLPEVKRTRAAADQAPAKPVRATRQRRPVKPQESSSLELPLNLSQEPAQEEDFAGPGIEAAAVPTAAVEVAPEPENFESNPEVQRVLETAPVAIPIPARALADKGIKPSEIAIAPVLNRVEIAPPPQPAPMPVVPVVVMDRPVLAEELPKAKTEPAAAPELTLTGRKGIDVARVRTIEEFQNDAPPPRSSSSKSGMEDSRIALLRAPLPGTNGNRKPSSPFYIRGVLHDRPLKVWFGGLFAVLLQLMVPIALIAAPLLILNDQKVPHFEWVPVWIIAFPIALPVLAILYAMVSSGAKCRVCGQRIYVPKNCLKNRKAHKAFYFGHIGALATHVMIFKWFNCTFCGTSIRIKK